MSDDILFDKITSIHDQTIATMRALRVPPFPGNYKKYFDEIFREQADLELKNIQKQQKESKEEHCTSCNYLTLAQDSVNSFVETHSNISHVADLQNNYIKQASSHDGERCSELIGGLAHLGDEMSNELKKAKSKIADLTAKLEKSIAESITDPLTQVMNRKGLINDLENIIEIGESKKLSTVLMMIDADNFKSLNDTYGHVAGDKVLYFMGQSIKSIIRTGDQVYRYGGEEFAVILNRCEDDQAFSIADKIRSKIEHSHLIYAGKTIQITVSIGVTIHHLKDSIEDFISRADTALYQAKQNGKNKTVLFD